jgi:hypothetical protein
MMASYKQITDQTCLLLRLATGRLLLAALLFAL